MPTTDVSSATNLLSDPLIRCRMMGGERQQLTLPGMLAILSDATHHLESFSFLQAHHAHGWHAFTVQLAAMVCRRAGVRLNDSACRGESWWRERLHHLAGSDSACSLLEDDLRKPAFMQPPVPEQSLDRFTTIFAHPDDFDVVVTTKNHDRKSARSMNTTGAWWPILLTSQSMQGFSGRANYGIFRMNGGFGNRPGIGYARPEDLGAWFRADVDALLLSRQESLAHGFSDHGHPLLWTIPWNGRDRLSLKDLDPWCIECCRRVRLVQREGKLVLVQAPTESPRVDAPKTLTGNVSDPWTPVLQGKALTLPAEGFSYRRAQELLFGSDWTKPATQQQPGEATAWVARTLVRGQGKTEGFHERHIPVSAKAKRWLATPTQQSVLAKRAHEYVEDVQNMHRKVLWPALKALSGERNDPPEAPLQAFEADADAHFFIHLLDDAHLDNPTAARRDWQHHIRDCAVNLLHQAIATYAPGTALRWRHVAKAESMFQHGLWAHFKDMMESSRSEKSA